MAVIKRNKENKVKTDANSSHGLHKGMITVHSVHQSLENLWNNNLSLSLSLSVAFVCTIFVSLIKLNWILTWSDAKQIESKQKIIPNLRRPVVYIHSDLVIRRRLKTLQSLCRTLLESIVTVR